MQDQDYIAEAAWMDLRSGGPIDELPLVVTANAWHGGQWSALYSYVSTGAIDAYGMTAEIDQAIDDADDTGHVDGPDIDALNTLRAFVEMTGDREPQHPWNPRW